MPIPDFIKTQIKENKTNYKYCDVSHSGLLDEDVEELITLLSQNKYINELNLYRNNLSNKGAEQLGKHLPRSITHLNVGANNINDDGIESLIKSKSIIELNLSSNNLTNNSVALILSVAGQKNIKVYHTQIDDEYLEKIQTNNCLEEKQQSRKEISFDTSEQHNQTAAFSRQNFLQEFFNNVSCKTQEIKLSSLHSGETNKNNIPKIVENTFRK